MTCSDVRLHASRPAATPLGAIGRTVAATSFGFALVQLDVTIVNVALPRISSDLGTGIAGLQWIVDAYALVFAAFLLTAGSIGDRLGARGIYLCGLGLFALASLACGLAPNIGSLIVARAVQGLAAAAMLPSSLSLLNRAAGEDPRLRAKAIGWWTAAGSITIAAGPIVGGLLLGVASWRVIFLVNLPVCAIGLLLSARLPRVPTIAKTQGHDILGQILGVVALAGIVGAVIEAKPLGPMHPLVLSGLAAGVLAALSFIRVEARARAPMLPLSLFRAPGFTACLAYGAVVNLTYYGIVFVLSLYLQKALGYGAAAAGLAYLPLTATFFLVNVLSGSLVARFGSRLPMVVGALIDAAGFALLLRLGTQSPYLAMLLPFALLPAGMGTGVPAMTAAILASVPKERAGIASAVLNAGRQAAGALGVALFGALAEGDAGHIVAGLHASALIAAGLLVAVSATAFVFVPRRGHA